MKSSRNKNRDIIILLCYYFFFFINKSQTETFFSLGFFSFGYFGCLGSLGYLGSMYCSDEVVLVVPLVVLVPVVPVLVFSFSSSFLSLDANCSKLSKNPPKSLAIFFAVERFRQLGDSLQQKYYLRRFIAMSLQTDASLSSGIDIHVSVRKFAMSFVVRKHN